MPPKVERNPPEKIRFSENWEQILTALNLNNTYKNRTCDVFFMVETSSASSIAVEKFYYGGQLDPLSRVKPLSFEEILTNIDHFSEGIPENTFQPSDQLYFYAAKEAKKYLDDHQPIPYHLMANLVKLQILFRIKKDISLTQKEILTATNLQNERTSLIAPVEPVGAGKKKKDTKKDYKGKGKKGADLQLYDVCDSNNVFQFKATSALKKEDEKLAVYHEGLDVEEKHLFIVLVGFFDYDLFEQLLKNGVPLLAVVEIVHDELCAESCNPNSCNRSVSEEFDDLEESQSSTKCCASFGDLKGETLYKFWKQFYECFVHSDGYPEYFGNTYHMTIKPSEDTFNAETCNEKICYDTFLNLSAEIAKSNDINRQHTNYIRKLKIYDVFPEPKYVPASKLDVYNKIMDATPPECFNVSFFLSAILEQICGAQNTVFHKETPRKRPLQKHPGFKTCVVELLNKNIHRHDRAKPNEEVPYDFSPKIELEIQRRPFLVNENDEVQIIISPYRKITPDFLEVFVHNVKFIYPILRFGFFKGDEQKHLENSFELKKISDYLGVCVQELLYVIHTIFFNSMSCKKEKIIKKTSLCELFPKVVDLAPTVKKFNVALKSSSEAEEPVGYSNYPNIYEAKNIATYKWYENLSKFVMLQELKKAETDYLCLDSMYCSFDDSFLLRYHNDCDDFGINRRTWNQPLRTYVNLKDFCKHIIWEEADWLAKEEKKYLEDFNKEFLHVKDADKQIKESFYPPLVFADSDFLQSGSLKARKLLELTQPPENAKDKGKDQKSSKKEAPKGKGNQQGAFTSQMGTLEKISQQTLPPKRKKLSLKFAAENTYDFFAYDVSNQRLQLQGSTIVFHSQDGVKITVDQTHFSRTPRGLSLNISAGGHNLILHKTPSQPFNFHFALNDQTFIAFGKPLKSRTPEEKLAQKICEAVKQQNNKKQDLFFISESQTHISKHFKIPFVTKKNLILSEELVKPFLKETSRRGIGVKLLPSTHSLPSEKIKELEEAIKSNAKSVPTPKRLYKILSGASKRSSKLQNEDANQPQISARKSFTSTLSDVEVLKISTPKIIRAVRSAIETRVPLFKICSSKLHKYQYVKRVKSFLEVDGGSILKRLGFKPPIYKPKKKLELSKLIPIKTSSVKNTSKYDLKLSLPSGLWLESVPGSNGEPFYFRQKYLDLGPQCRNVSQEFSRSFLRNGNWVIKSRDGNYEILDVTGKRASVEVPYFKVKLEGLDKSKKACKFSHLTPLHAHTSSLPKYQRHLQRVLLRLEKHLIRNGRSHYLRSHNACQRWKRNHITDPNQMYLLQNVAAPFKKFTLITTEGKKIRVSSASILEEKKYYTSSITDYRYEEVYYEREDGTHGILNREGLLVTQFPDGSRISSWVEVAPELIKVIEDEEPLCSNGICHAGIQTSVTVGKESVSVESASEVSSEASSNVASSSVATATSSKTSSEVSSIKNKKKEETGWVSLFTNFKFEHPNYATVVYHGMDGKTEIFLPNNLKLEATKTGEYFLEIGGPQIKAEITTERLLFEAALCSSCLEKCSTSLNIKPFYQKTPLDNLELLRTVDSFNKVFVVKYDGSCYKSAEFNSSRVNRAGCKFHHQFEYQKLFLLTRSLNGCKFWDVNSYENKIKRAQDLENCEVKITKNLNNEDHPNVAFKTFHHEPYDERFLLPYEEPTLKLTKYKSKNKPPPTCFYVTRRILKSLPGITLLFPIYESLQKVRSRDIDFPEFSEIDLFLNQLICENSKKEMELEEERIAKENAPPEIKEPSEPIITLSQRWRTWREICERYKKDIKNKYVPLYFKSKFLKGNEEEIEEEEKAEEDTENACEILSRLRPGETLDSCTCPKEIPPTIKSPCKCNMVNKEPPSEKVPPPIPKVEEIKPQPLPPPKDIKINVIEEYVNILQSSNLGGELLREIKNRLEGLLRNLTTNPNEVASKEKVEYVTEKIFKNLIVALNFYKSNILRDDFVTSTTILISNDIVEENLNVSELKLLLQNVTHGISSGLCFEAAGKGYESCSEALQGSSASKLNLQNVEVLDDSAFEVYAFYSHQKRLKAQRSKSSSFGSLSNMNKSQSRTKSTTLLILEPPKTLRNNTPKESCTHLDKNNQPIGEDKCLKCLSITKAYKIERMSDVKSQLSLKGCYYPSFPSAADCSSIVKTSESSLRERSTSYLSKSSSDSPPFDIKLSPESSLLRYCISDVSMGSENLSIIDETTVALKREDTEQQKSLLVLFSVGSLEDKAVQKAPPGSFVSRKITEGEDGILSATKSFSKEVHKCMLEDSPRNEAYKAAIFSNAASIKGKTILDVGAGTGILSVLCAKAGAAKVFAVEASGIYKIAEEIVAENQVQQIVEVIHGAVEDISLPGDGKVDVIVSEWMGHFLVHEGMLDSVIKARDKFLRPNGLIFPENATLYSAPCSIPSMNTYWNDVSGVSMTKFCEKLKSQAPQVPRIMTVKAEHILSDPEIILWVDLREVTVDDLKSATVRHLAVVDKPGRYQGICLWFVCSFPGAQSDPVVLSTEADEPPTHWQQTVIALPVDIPVEEGAPVCYDLTLKRSEGDRRKYTLEVEMLDPDTVEHPEYCFCFKTKCILTRAVLEKYESRCFSEETTEMTPVNRD